MNDTVRLAPTPAQLARRIAVARGDEPADLIVAGGQLINVFSGEIYPADVALADGFVAGIGTSRGREYIDATGLFVAPGFIDAHIHIESTMLTPAEFARVVVPLGTTTVVADPHEIANVWGLAGIDYMLESTADLPLSVFFMLPSCVPATALESAGAQLGTAELATLIDHPRVLGLAEVMNYPGVIRGDTDVLAKIRLAGHKSVDGHAPGLSGAALNAYVAAGIGSDHESTSLSEATEKLRAGMQIFIREGTVAKNLAALLPLVTPATAWRCGLVTDDRHPTDLLTEGHVDFLLRRAVAAGLSPLTAIALVTASPAAHFRLGDRGAVAPGYRADLALIDSLETFRARIVIAGGCVVARDGSLCIDLPPSMRAPAPAIDIGWSNLGPIALPANGHRHGKVIDLIPNQLTTGRAVLPMLIRDGCAIADPSRDLCKLIVVERHHATGSVGVGFVRGFGLQAGALASTVAHDSHNIVVAGTSDAELMFALRAVEQIGGGLVAVRTGAILAAVPLPIAGLMSDRSGPQVAAQMCAVLDAAHGLGSYLDDPFMALSFLALPVIPALRLTDRGLVDVERFTVVPVLGDD